MRRLAAPNTEERPMTSEDPLLVKIRESLGNMPYWQIGLLSVLILALGACAFLLLRQPGRAATIVSEAPPLEDLETETANIVVYVAGAVQRPGVYEMAAGDRVADALQAAGGVLPDADPSSLNLASRLHDGEKIAVPRVGETPPSTGSPGNRPVNLNLASEAELDQVPGIGPVLAQRIIDYRESHGGFKDISELKQVEGIGPKKYEDLKERVEI